LVCYLKKSHSLAMSVRVDRRVSLIAGDRIDGVPRSAEWHAAVLWPSRGSSGG
jgi:hypothetical protein